MGIMISCRGKMYWRLLMEEMERYRGALRISTFLWSDFPAIGRQWICCSIREINSLNAISKGCLLLFMAQPTVRRIHRLATSFALCRSWMEKRANGKCLPTDLPASIQSKTQATRCIGQWDWQKDPMVHSIFRSPIRDGYGELCLRAIKRPSAPMSWR